MCFSSCLLVTLCAISFQIKAVWASVSQYFTFDVCKTNYRILNVTTISLCDLADSFKGGAVSLPTPKDKHANPNRCTSGNLCKPYNHTQSVWNTLKAPFCGVSECVLQLSTLRSDAAVSPSPQLGLWPHETCAFLLRHQPGLCKRTEAWWITQ